MLEEMQFGPKFFLTLLFVALAAGVGAAAPTFTNRSTSAISNTGPDFSSCNVLGIKVHGTIIATGAELPGIDVPTKIAATTESAISNDIENTIRSAMSYSNIKALLVDVDSEGGGSVAGDEIVQAIQHFGRPSVSVIHGAGLSSGYLAAAGADTIFASKDSSIGSIGTTASFMAQYEKDKKDGLTYVQLSVGKFKDMFSPDKPLTDEERALVMRDVKIDRDNFVKLIAELRHQPVEKIDALADGSPMLGEQALASGLIDHLGGTWDAIDYLEKKIGEPVNLCWQ